MLSSKNISIPGVTIIHSKEELLNYIYIVNDEVMVIGGGVIYKMLIDDASRLLLTEIGSEDKDADVYFPSFDKSNYRKTVLKKVREKGIDFGHIEYRKE